MFCKLSSNIVNYENNDRFFRVSHRDGTMTHRGISGRIRCFVNVLQMSEAPTPEYSFNDDDECKKVIDLFQHCLLAV